MEDMKEFVLSLTWVDFVIVFGLIRGAHIGYRDGLFKEALRIILYIVAIGVMISFSGIIADYLSENTVLGGETAMGLTVTAVTLITYLALKIITDIILKLAKLDNNFLLKITGLLVGCLRWASILSLIFLLIEKTDIGTELLEGSKWAGHLKPIAPTVLIQISEVLPGIDVS